MDNGVGHPAGKTLAPTVWQVSVWGCLSGPHWTGPKWQFDTNVGRELGP